MVNRFLKAGHVQKYSLSSLKKIICGGSLLKAEVQAELRRIVPHVQILQGYGNYHIYNTIK